MTQKELRALADKEVIEFVDYVFDFSGPGERQVRDKYWSLSSLFSSHRKYRSN